MPMSLFKSSSRKKYAMMLTVLTLIVIGDCYQVAPDPNNSFKDAIKKATKQRNVRIVSSPPPLPLPPSDDERYSPSLLQNSLLVQGKKHVPLSDILRFESESDTRMQPSALPLFRNGFKFVTPHRNGVARKRFGYDDMPSEYWFNNRIHSLGNTGLTGWIHAAIAPLATKLIDNAAYQGEDVRTRVSKALRKTVDKQNVRILDLCCGVGMSTRALASAFQDNADLIVGIDTSPEMIAMAKNIMKYQELQSIFKQFKISSNVLSDITALVNDVLFKLLPSLETSSESHINKLFYSRGNAERVRVDDQSFDLVTIMYAFHEIPKSARYRILREARRLLKDDGTLAIIDISPTYCPSATMLSGEPYVLEYQKNIWSQLVNLRGFSNFQEEVVVEGHVHMWQMTRKRKGI